MNSGVPLMSQTVAQRADRMEFLRACETDEDTLFKAQQRGSELAVFEPKVLEFLRQKNLDAYDKMLKGMTKDIFAVINHTR